MNYKELTHSFTKQIVYPDFHVSELSSDPKLLKALKELYPDIKWEEGRTRVRLLGDTKVEKEGFRIEFDDVTKLYASTHSGYLYGMMALVHIAREIKEIDYSMIIDYPDLSFRGFMLDISRNRIPTLYEAKKWLRLACLSRLNHFELYVEGYSFAYESFGPLPFETPLTKADFITLQEYASLLGIDLVPNMNTLGHMTEWLAQPQYRHLCEKEDGFDIWGYHFPPSTLNPLNPESVSHVLQMLHEMTSISQSRFFHVNMDEPFELGSGLSKEACESTSKAKVYLNYQNQIFSWLKERHFTPLFWADVLIHHPEVFDEIDHDSIVCDWGYDFDYPFESHATILEKHHLQYVLCPGTSSWNSITSRRRDMEATLSSAVSSAKNHAGLGVLMTDWGDFGHLQPSLFSYPGLLLTGILCWGEDWTQEEVRAYLNRYFYQSPIIYDIVQELSSYSQLENQYVYNSTMVFQSLMHVDPSNERTIAQKHAILKNAVMYNVISDESMQAIRTLCDQAEAKIPAEGELQFDELRYSIQLLRSFLSVNFALTRNTSYSVSDRLMLENCIVEHDRLWLKTSLPGGMEKSVRRLKVLLEIMDEQNHQTMIY